MKYRIIMEIDPDEFIKSVIADGYAELTPLDCHMMAKTEEGAYLQHAADSLSDFGITIISDDKI